MLIASHKKWLSPDAFYINASFLYLKTYIFSSSHLANKNKTKIKLYCLSENKY